MNIFDFDERKKMINIDNTFEKELRKYQRYSTELPATLHLLHTNTSKPAVIRDISLCGFRLNTKTQMFLEQIVSISVVVDNLYNFKCKTKVIRRKTTDGDLFLYGMEITEISDQDLIFLKDYLSALSIHQNTKNYFV